MNKLYALIMAGGGGTRLWPLSRKNRPKQMLPLTEDRTMFAISVERLLPLLPAENIFIVTGASQVDGLRALTPQIPAENFVVEPFGQNTGPAVGLGTVHIRQRDPDAIIAVVTADHHIAQEATFRDVLSAAAQLAAEDRIVTLGISPSFPSTGFGYIKRGELLREVNGFPAYDALEFTEKPGQEAAIEFLASGLYSWNGGMFIWRAAEVMRQFQQQQPEMAAILDEIGAAVGTDDYQPTLDRLWPQIKRISIDYAVMEGADNIVVLPIDVGWSDIGSWDSLFDLLEGDAEGNVKRGKGPDPIWLNTRRSMIFSDRKVVVVGLDHVFIVDSENALLVCHGEQAQAVREIVDQLKAENLTDYL